MGKQPPRRAVIPTLQAAKAPTADAPRRISFFFTRSVRKKAEQNQPADRDKIQLNARAARSPAAPQQTAVRTGFSLSRRIPSQRQRSTSQWAPQRHVHRHLGQQDRRKDKQKAAHRGLGLFFPHNDWIRRDANAPCSRKHISPHSPKYWKLLRQDPPEELEEYRKKRHRIRKDHRYLIGPGHPVHQPDRKGPRAVPEKCTSQGNAGSGPRLPAASPYR